MPAGGRLGLQPMRRLLVLVALVSAVAASAAQATAPTPPLGHEGRWITDASGRVVILHGLNMVYKRPPYYPKASGFDRDDADFLARHGFNTIRLGVIYKAVEPQPRAYDDAYLGQIADTERLLERRGIYSLLDFHQDLYNERFQGEGWPDWAVQDDGLPNPENGFPANYLTNPALNRAFDHFWSNDALAGVRLQNAYAAAWRHVAAAFASNPYMLGYDIMNEPWPGSVYPTCTNPAGCPAFDATTLTQFTNRVIARIRQVDPGTLAFYEPLLTFDFGALTWHGDTGDPQAGFSFHDYCLPGAFGGPTGDACQAAEDLPFQNADDRSHQTGDALLLPEFGATDDLATLARIVGLADEHMLGWQEWHYCGCGDPTTQAAGDEQALVIDPKRPPSGDNLKRQKLAVLERPYPQATAGTPSGYGYDAGTDVFHLAYSTTAPTGDLLPRTVTTRIYLPRIHYPDGYSVDVNGATVVSEPGARYLELRRNPGASRVSVTVRPL